MPQPLLEATGHVVVLAVVLGVAALVKALASVARVWIEQAWCTRRFFKAMENAEPSERADIILAYSRLEGQLAEKPGNKPTDHRTNHA